MTVVDATIDRFLVPKSMKLYQAMGTQHKHGILLHGPYGTGKTSILSRVIQKIVRYGGMCISVPSNLQGMQAASEIVRTIEPNRLIAFIFEDIDEHINYSEWYVTNFMDGLVYNSMAPTLFIATTNSFKDIPPRIRCRPGRIDTCIYVGHADAAIREEYLRFILKEIPADCYPKHAPQTVDSFVATVVPMTEKMTLAQLRGFVQSVFIHDVKLADAIANARMAGVFNDGDDEPTEEEIKAGTVPLCSHVRTKPVEEDLPVDAILSTTKTTLFTM
jgi:SpoVK/Ycf46/Vps4 family AAA+-type ATPase